jgi:hypothetical protein
MMHGDMNKGMKSIGLFLMGMLPVLLVTYCILTGRYDLDAWNRESVLLLAGVVGFLGWVAISNVFDAMDGVKNCINHHVLHKTLCE